MALETATYIDGLVSTNPTSSDNVSQGDDHIRLLKATLKATFPNLTGAVTADQSELNKLDGLTVSTADLNKLTSSGSPQFSTIELGAASDTTLSRVSAGVVAVEGKNIALNGTSEALTTGTIELGHATDTTISRVSAGLIAVEGGNVPLENRANTFTANQIISVTDNTNAALRITQLGTGAALRVEDEANPDGSPFLVNGNGSVGIGTTTPESKLVVSLNSTSDVTGLPAVAFDGIHVIGGASGAGLNTDTFGSTGQITFRRSNGTLASPSALASGDVIGSLTFRGYGASAYSSGNRGLVQLVASENWTNTAQGTYWQFNTVASGGASSTEKLRIADNGVLTNKPSYDNTVTGSALQVTSAGVIGRTSSSIKYKKDVETLDHDLADNAINNLRPVWYRTKEPNGDDKETWSHIGLIAEEVDLVEKRLVKYRTVDVTFDEEGNRVEAPLASPEPEDVDYARLSVLLLDVVKRQKDQIAALETRVSALEAA